MNSQLETLQLEFTTETFVNQFSANIIILYLLKTPENFSGGMIWEHWPEMAYEFEADESLWNVISENYKITAMQKQLLGGILQNVFEKFIGKYLLNKVADLQPAISF